MRVFLSRVSFTLALTLATSPFLFADYTYQETTQLTGGSLLNMMKMVGHFSSQARKAGEPVVSTVYLKGNRMATVNADSIEIIDLDKETITHVDTQKKTYTVMTFEQMKQQIENARKEMEKKQAEHPASAPQSNQNPNDVKVSFDVKVRKTGAEKQVNGLSSKEAILTMTMNATDQKTQQSGAMAVTNDMWMVPEVPGYDQVREFQNLTRAMPVRQAQESVHAEEQAQGALGKFSAQLDERIHGIGHATAANFAVVDHEGGLVRDGRSDHLQPQIGTRVRRLPVRRAARGHDPHLRKVQFLPQLERRAQVPVMDRIELAAKDTNRLHRRCLCNRSLSE